MGTKETYPPFGCHGNHGPRAAQRATLDDLATPAGGGEIHSREGSQGAIVSPLGSSLEYSSPDGPPYRGFSVGSVPSRLLPIFTDFSDFLGRLLVIVEFYSHDYLFTCMFFFSEIVLWRNRFIKRVELFEEKSILVFP